VVAEELWWLLAAGKGGPGVALPAGRKMIQAAKLEGTETVRKGGKKWV